MNFGVITLNQSIETMENCYMDTDSFIIHIKTEDFYKDIGDDVNGLTHQIIVKMIKDHFQQV